MDTDIGSPTWQLCGGKLAACRSASTDLKQIYLIIELQLKFSLDARFSQRDKVFKIFFWLQQSVEFTVTYNLLKVAEDACGLLEELTKCSHILPKCLKSRSLHSAGVLLGRVNVTNLAIVYSTGPVLFGDRGSGSRRGAERRNIYKY